MDNSFDQQETEVQSKIIFNANLPKIIDGIINWILSLFLLTEKEKEDAYVYIRNMEDDE